MMLGLGVGTLGNACFVTLLSLCRHPGPLQGPAISRALAQRCCSTDWLLLGTLQSNALQKGQRRRQLRP